MTQGRSCVGFAGIHKSLISAGGFANDGTTRIVERYDIKSNKWEKLTNLIYERVWPGICCFSDT